MTELTGPSRRWRAILLVAAVFVAARLPLHRATFALPVSNDDAIPLLMAKAVLRGELSTTLWNQPYNGALDAYLLAPLLAAFGAHHAFRLYELACAAALVAVVAALARRLAGERAALAAALLAAFGTPYMVLMAATGPTPNFLVPLLVAIPLLWASGERATHPLAGLGAGIVAGVAVWDSALALPSLAGIAAGLVATRSRLSWRSAAAAAAGAALGVLPLLAARWTGAQAASTVTNVRPQWLWTDGVMDLGRAAAGLFGVQVPLVVDGPERAGLPMLLAALLAVALAGAVALGLARRALPLVGGALLLAGAFAFSRRTGGDEVRYLYGLVVPALALAGAGLVRVPRWPIALAALLVPWTVGHAAVLRAWRQPEHASRAWEVVPLEPARETLQRAAVRSAYASLQFAGRLTLETDGAVVASQAWNERIPGDPLRLRDEVDLDPRAAWVLSPHLSRGMPRAGGFRALVAGLGGTWHEDLAGDLVIFRSFGPPYDEGRSIPPSGWTLADSRGTALDAAARDRDPHTAATSTAGLSAGQGLVLDLTAPRRLSALVLLVDLERSPLAVPWIADVDGATVSQGPAAYGLQWINGAPRAGLQALMVVPLRDRAGRQVRLVFQGAGPPLIVKEAFLYGTDEAVRPDAGAEAAGLAYDAARANRWADAVAGYAESVRRAPERASHHAALARAEWRAARRTRWDVESLPDGGDELVARR